jgi:hypothetical protein
MELTIMALMAFLVTVFVVFAVGKIGEEYYNIKALRDGTRHPDRTKQKTGIVYNKKTKTLEADQSTITPF